MINNFNFTDNKLRISNLVFVILILSVPSNINFFFDGLPLNNKVEILFILIVIPFIYFFNKKLFVNKKFLLFLAIFLIFKIITNYSLNNHKLFSDIIILNEKNPVELNLFQKNPETFWNDHTTEINKNFNNKSDFFNSWGSRFDNQKKNNINISLLLRGQIRLKANEIFLIKTNGELVENFNLIKKNVEDVYEYKNISSNQKFLNLTKYEFEFKNKEKWYLQFELNSNGKKIDPFVHKRFIQSKAINKNLIILDIFLYYYYF